MCSAVSSRVKIDLAKPCMLVLACWLVTELIGVHRLIPHRPNNKPSRFRPTRCMGVINVISLYFITSEYSETLPLWLEKFEKCSNQIFWINSTHKSTCCELWLLFRHTKWEPSTCTNSVTTYLFVYAFISASLSTQSMSNLIQFSLWSTCWLITWILWHFESCYFKT